MSTDRGRFAPELRDAADEMDAADPLLAVMPDVVENDERPVRPAAEDRSVELQLPDGGVDVGRPQPRVIIAVARRAPTSRGPAGPWLRDGSRRARSERNCRSQVSQLCEVPWMNRIRLDRVGLPRFDEVEPSASSLR